MSKYRGNIWLETVDRRGKKLKRYHVKKKIRGRQRYGTFSTREAAVFYLEQLELEAKGIRSIRMSPSLEVVLDEWLAIKSRPSLGRSPATLRDYRQSRDALIRVLGKGCDVQLTDTEIDSYVTARQTDGAGNGRILKELQHLRAATRRALREEPTWYMPELKKVPTRKRLPSDDELAAVYRRLLDRPDVLRAWLLALLTGIRPGDVVRAEGAWLRFDATRTASTPGKDRVMAVPMQKRGGRVNELPVVGTLAGALWGWDGEPVTADALKRALYHRTKDMEHTWYGLHLLRHTLATWLAEAGFSQEEIGVVLGHGAETVAGRHYIQATYAKLKRRALRRVEQRFLRALAGVTKGS